VLIGLSGGADSVCLFLLLLEFAKEFSLGLVPVHVNHNLRGEEAVADQHFCEELCRQHGLELTVVSVPVAELAAEKMGLKPELKTTGGCSDGNFLCGYGLPCALLATGMSNVHTTEEYLKEDDLFGTAQWMYEIVKLNAEQ
jgi:hypothetical protein